MLSCREGAGIVERPVPEEFQGRPCLDEEEIKKLLQYSLKLEEYYQTPQDIEWAINGEGNIYLLQTRPLKISPPPKEKQGRRKNDWGHKALIDSGVVAATGAAGHRGDQHPHHLFTQGGELALGGVDDRPHGQH